MQKVLENRCQSCKKSDNIWGKYTSRAISPIWVKFLKVYIFPKYCHFFCNFDSCFLALFALVLLFQLFLWVNHMCRSRENQVFDPSPQVRYLRKPMNMDDFEVFSHLFPFCISSYKP